MCDEESYNQDAGAEVNDEDPPLLKCDNCSRHEIPNCTSDCALNMRSSLSSDIAISRPHVQI